MEATTMTSSVDRTKDYSSWQEHRDVIHRLYVLEKRSQHDVLEILRNPPYELYATAAQFETILGDVLKISKNLKGHDWVAIRYHQEKRKRQDGKQSIVYINGIAQNPKKIQRQATRYRRRTPGQNAASPLLPSSVILKTPPSSPVYNSNTVSASHDARIERELTIEQTWTSLNTGDLTEYELSNLMYFEDATLNGPGQIGIPGDPQLSTCQMDLNWSNWTEGADFCDFTALDVNCSLTIIDRYSTLLDSLPWFEFTDWLAPKLEHLLRPRSSPSSIQTHTDRTERTKLPVIARDVMWLSKIQPGGIQKAVQFLAGVIPERYNGQLSSKVSGFNIPAHAHIQAAELLLSLLANNHKSMSSETNAHQLREWIMEIPITLLELIVQRTDPTAVAISNRMLIWSIDHGYSDVFHQLLKAKISTKYMSGAQGGKILLKTLENRYSSRIRFTLDVIACNPSLDERTSPNRETALHLAARHSEPKVLKALIDRGANLEAQNGHYNTPFQEAFHNGVTENVKWFLENGVSVQELESVLDRIRDAPSFDLCDWLWKTYPKASRRLPAFVLIYSAISGTDGFANKVVEVSQYYDDIASILEMSLCIAMKVLHEYENSEPFHEYYWSINSNRYDDDDDEDEEIDEYSSLEGSDIIRFFLEYGVDPNTNSVTRHTPPLVSAIRFWTAQEVETLLNYGAHLDQTRVMKALFQKPPSARRFTILRHIFIDRRSTINMNSRLPNGQYPLQAICASHKGREGFALAKYFIDNGAEVNSFVSATNHYTALHYAVEHGQLETTRYLIEHGARVKRWLVAPHETLYQLCLRQCPSECGWNTREDKQEEVEKRIAIWQLLLGARAEVDEELDTIAYNFRNSLAQAIETWKPKSPLVKVVMRTQGTMSGTVGIPLWQKANQQKGPFSPLQLAVKYDDIEMVKYMVTNGANINEAAGDNGGATTLQLAVKQTNSKDGANLELVSYFLDHSADVNAIGAKKGGRTALQQACEFRTLNYQLIHLLLEHKADVNGPPAETSGRTALQLACTREDIDFDLVNLLLDRGSNINAPAGPIQGITALQGAVINGNIELVIQLLERGAQVDAPGAKIEGRTTLEAAAEYGRLMIAKILLNAYESVQAIPKLDSAIKLARSEGHLGVVKLLEEYQKTNPKTL